MMKYGKIFLLIYLIASFSIFFLILSIAFSTFEYWLHDGQEIIEFIKSNVDLYLKMLIAGSFVGFMFFIFSIL